MTQGYFNHYNLFSYVNKSGQSERDMEILVYVDTPRDSLPLSSAHFIGKKMQ
jgi:hypothetical protein